MSYLTKKIFNIKPTQKENEIYIYYNYLIQFKGILLEETRNSFITVIKRKKKNVKIKLRKYPSSDLEVFQQVFFWEGYLPAINIYKNYFGNQKDSQLNIIDCGSNIGLTSLFFLDFFPESQIIAIEPEPGNFKILNFNLDDIAYPNIHKLNAAVWSRNSKIEIIRDFRNKSDWSFRVEETKGEDFVDAYTINQIVKKFFLDTIDILKIDIEGSEKELFTSLNANIEFLKITKCIALEIHDEFNCREEICTILRDNNFVLMNSGELTIGYNEKLAKDNLHLFTP